MSTKSGRESSDLAEQWRKLSHEIAWMATPHSAFYLLVVLSTVISSFGLLANSTAVVIGAMLVAPLMGPIFGIAFGLATGDNALLAAELNHAIDQQKRIAVRQNGENVVDVVRGFALNGSFDSGRSGVRHRGSCRVQIILYGPLCGAEWNHA